MSINHADIPAIDGGTPVRDEFLPFFRPAISETDVQFVAESLRSGWLTLGPRTQEFERLLSSFLGVDNVVAVSSCTAAMTLLLKAIELEPGDEVVTSALTFASTVQSIIHAGGRPVLADVEPVTFGVCPDDMERRTTERTRAYLPVHFAGQACRIDDVLRLAAVKGLRVIEDAAHAFGATHRGCKVGGFGDGTAFSFYATKNLTSGEGGCVSTSDPDLAAEVRRLSYHGMSADSWKRYEERGAWYYEVDRVGFKYNMSDVLSSLGISQLKRIDQLLDDRRDIAKVYTHLLRDVECVDLPEVGENNGHTWHLFVIRLDLERLRIDRDHFIRALAAENIGCSVHFIPVYRHPFFGVDAADYGAFPVCEDYYSRCISLPIFPGMHERDVRDVAEAIERIARYHTKT